VASPSEYRIAPRIPQNMGICLLNEELLASTKDSVLLRQSAAQPIHHRMTG
jgi:hypothetical protein